MTATSMLSPPAPDGASTLDSVRLEGHVQALYRQAQRLCGSRDDAHELVHETCERILRRPRVLRTEYTRAYLLRALKNTWINRDRARRNIAMIATQEELEGIVDPGADLDVTVQVREICAAIHALSPRYRDTILAVDVVGLSYRQAADVLHVPEGTVMSRLYRARAHVAAATSDVAA